MLILPSSEPSGALVKNQSSEPAFQNQRFRTSVSEPAVVRVSKTKKRNEKLAETADK